MSEFARDCAEIAQRRYARGEINRRDFLLALGALGVAPQVASAQAKELVVVNYGGAAAPAFTEAWTDPFTKESGVKTVIDTSGPTAGKIRAMVESRKVTWDVCDSGPGTALELGALGLLEEMDYGIVDRSKVTDPKFTFKWGIANYSFSFVLGYDTTKFKDDPPKSWADFWDVRKYPGKRTMWASNILGICESALLADGVPRDKIYPMDVDRALRKLKEIKPHVIGWKSGAQSEELLRTGEVVMGNVWNTRANLLNRETNGRIDWTWNQGILAPGVWVVPKGNPAGRETAMRFIASSQIPERQVALLRLMGQGPVNPAAAALVPAELAKINPSSADNVAKQVIFDGEWYGQHQSTTLERWMDLLAS